MLKPVRELGQYVRQRWPVFIIYALAVFLFPAINYLYGNTLTASLYADLILTFFFLLAVIPDFAAFRQRRKELAMCREIKEPAALSLPRTGSPLEREYQELIGALAKKTEDMLHRLKEKSDARMDYFTLWIHQIKTPISALTLLIQSAGEKGLPTQEMEQELFSICRYVDMVLEYLRLDTITNDFSFQECDLNPVIKAVIRKYAAVFIHKRIYIKLEELPFRVITDEKWISLIAEQLISNAVKYTKTGGVTIFMEENPLALVVEDTGIGIRTEDQRRIFERGFTGFNGRMKEKSTGLGLFLAKEAADKLDCRLDVESAPGKGSRFRILFPRNPITLF